MNGIRFEVSGALYVTGNRASASIFTGLPYIRTGGMQRIVPTINNAGLNRLEAWALKNSSWLAVGAIVVAFALRFANANSCYLNPDEALHFDVARPSRWLWAFQASRTVTHPPLFVLALHGILFFGRTELTLRLPSLIGGTAALWLAFAWLRRSLGELLALAGLGFMALSCGNFCLDRSPPVRPLYFLRLRFSLSDGARSLRTLNSLGDCSRSFLGRRSTDTLCYGRGDSLSWTLCLAPLALEGRATARSFAHGCLLLCPHSTASLAIF